MDHSKEPNLWALNHSRRSFLRTTGLGAMTVAVGGSLLAACGSDNDQSGGTPSAGTTDLDLIRTQLGVTDANSGKGTTIKAAYIGPLSGPGQPYSVDQIAGIKAAISAIEKLGGPKFDVTYLDHKSGDPQAGLSAFQEMLSKDIDILFDTYAGNLGTLIDPIAENKIFTMDAGGSAIISLNHPFFWNAAPVWSDFFPGTFVHLKKKHPDAKTFCIVSADQGGQVNDAVEGAARKFAPQFGFEMKDWILASGLAEGNPDFGTVLSKVRAAKTDVVLLEAMGNLVGNFMTQYLQAGLSAPVDVGVFNPIDLEVGGSAMNGVTSTATYMFPKFPDNPLGKMLVDEYEGDVTNFQPNWNSGFFFQAAINIWEASMLCNAAGLPVTAENLNDQMLKGPTVHSPFGGSSTAIAQIKYDTTQHIATGLTVHNVTIDGGHVILESTNNLKGDAFAEVSPALQVA